MAGKLHCENPPCPSVKMLFDGFTTQQKFTNAILLMVLAAVISFGYKAIGASHRADDATDAVAQKVAVALRERGMQVVMTRTRDTLIALSDRGKIANEHLGDLFLKLNQPQQAVKYWTSAYQLDNANETIAKKLRAHGLDPARLLLPVGSGKTPPKPKPAS